MSAKFTIPTTFKAIDKYSSVVSGMARTNDKAMDRMQRKFNSVSKKSFEISKKSAMVGAAIIAPMGVLANEAVGFEKSMSNVSTLIDTSTESIEQMGQNVLDLATKLPVPVEELTASLYDIRSAGISADRAMGTLETSAKLSAAGLSTTEDSTNILTSALNAFKSQGLDASETADILFKTVKAGKTTIAQMAQSFGQSAPIISEIGVKLEDFSAATAALTTTGRPASVAQNQLAQAMMKLNKPTSDMEQLFRTLGVKTGKELIASSENMVDVFHKINSAAEQNGISLSKALGSSEAYSAVVSLLGDQGDAYASTLASMTNGQNELNTAFSKQNKTASAQMQVMKNNLKAVSIQLGQALLPLLVDAAKAITPVVQSFARWVKNNKPLVKTLAKVAAGVGIAATAISGISFAIGVATKAAGLFGVTLAATPIGWIIAGVAGLAAGMYAVSKAFNQTTRAEKLNNEVKQRAIDIAGDQIAEVKMHFMALSRLEAGTQEYRSTLAKIEQIQPGITKQYNLQTGAVESRNAAEKALIATLMQRAEQEARMELAKEKIKEGAALAAEDTGIFDAIGAFVSKTASVFTGDKELKQRLGSSTAESIRQANVDAKFREAELLFMQHSENQNKPDPLSLDKAKQEMITKNISETKEKVDINFNNLPQGTEVNSTKGVNFSVPNVSNTN